MLSKVASSTLFWVFGMTRPGIEPSSVNHDQVQVFSYSKYFFVCLLFLLVVGIEPATSRWFHTEALSDKIPYPQPQYETPEEGRRIYRPKRSDYSNKDEVNSLNSNYSYSYSNYQDSSQKLRPTYNSIQHYSFVCTQSNGSKYCYVIPINQFLHTVKNFQAFLTLFFIYLVLIICFHTLK